MSSSATASSAGDRVLIYLPMVPEAAIAMLACARIGAVHSVVFGGFSAQSVADRIQDSQAKLVVTADGGFRRGAVVPLKQNVDEALTLKDAQGELLAKTIEKVIVLRRTNNEVQFQEGRDLWWHHELESVDAHCPAEKMDSEAPLFILYTSGSTGKPKGILHTTGGYLLYAKLTTKYVFDLRDEDLYWCTADVGWVTGHSYVVYGPLANGATSLMYEGAPNFPEPDRFWRIVEKYGVTILYTAPTAIRAFMKWGVEWPQKHDLSSLRLLGTVGEPINPEAWMWYNEFIGGKRCPIVDTWWQTETGGILITPLPGATPTKPGSATLPFFGIVPEVVDDYGQPVPRNSGGKLVIRKPWPGMLRGLWGDPQRYQQVYWSEVDGSYFTGDGSRQDKDGYFWIVGRIDDVLNVAGHRIGTAEVESALVSHQKVAEAAVVGRPGCHERPGAGGLRDGQRRRPCRWRPARGVAPARRQGNRPGRQARRHPLRRGAAENALGQNHAPPAQANRRRHGNQRRHHHARRPRRPRPPDPCRGMTLSAGRSVSLRGQ